MIDAFAEAGGLACTDVTPEGFLFDMGGHVIFSHFQYFDDLIDAAVGVGDAYWANHQRVSYVWLKKTWVPYPFQNNIQALPVEDQIKCINGLVEAKVANATAPGKPTTFDEWIVRVMGDGIANLFMRPYNFKVWAFPTTDMQCGWLGERVATADTARVIRNVLTKQEDAGWGPNATFRFPHEGGTGAIWTKVAKLLPADKQRYGVKVVALDLEGHCVTLDTGRKIRYQKLLSTIPLDLTLRMVGHDALAAELHYSSTHIVGIGLRGVNPHDLKCWLYYPEDDCPFYRCTIFSHYAKANAPADAALLPTLRLASGDAPASAEPQPGPYWSLMFEISESIKKPVDLAKIVEETIQGAINVTLCAPGAEIVSLYHRRLEHGYPTPHLKRDGALAKALPLLQKHDVWSRGRFGSYKYEVANQDHSCMIGVEAADNMLFGTKEFTLMHPSLANEGGAKNTELKYTPPKKL
jgi:protoporphyrinogen oxidase